MVFLGRFGGGGSRTRPSLSKKGSERTAATGCREGELSGPYAFVEFGGKLGEGERSSWNAMRAQALGKEKRGIAG